MCTCNDAHFQGWKVHNYLSSYFLWFSLDRTIWKISRRVQFHRVCTARLAHPEYTPLMLIHSVDSIRVSFPKQPSYQDDVKHD